MVDVNITYEKETDSLLFSIAAASAAGEIITIADLCQLTEGTDCKHDTNTAMVM